MSDPVLLVAAMAERCGEMLGASCPAGAPQPRSIQRRHLMAMCDAVVRHAGDWPVAKLHRWLGFIQGAMVANGIVDLAGAKAMFDRAKASYAPQCADMLDHLSPDSQFEVDIGGEG